MVIIINNKKAILNLSPKIQIISKKEIKTNKLYFDKLYQFMYF
jgi:hypothetical protein